MELFGVQEVPHSRSVSTPGWAYVPDTGVNASVAALQPASRKRARNQTSIGNHEKTLKQDARILRELAALDRENQRDMQIPVPTRRRNDTGRGGNHQKTTAAVRKILQSQKTFANYLADAEAHATTTVSQSQQPSQTQSQSPTTAHHPPAPMTRPKLHTNATPKRSHKKKDESAAPATKADSQNVVARGTEEVKYELDTNLHTIQTAVSSDLLLTPLPATLELKRHPGDTDLLLRSSIPAVPTEEELAALIAIPPLSYSEARGQLSLEDLRKPLREFCEICGYWGRVKCLKCGTRVCALECLRTHQEDCYMKYGA